MANYFLHFNGSNEPSYPFWGEGFMGKQALDHEYFLREIGFRQIDAFFYRWPEEPKDSLNARMDGILGGLKINDCLLIQWPLPDMGERWLQKLIKKTHEFGAKLIFLINGLTSWSDGLILPGKRNQGEIQKALRNPKVQLEMLFLHQADAVITSSLQMVEQLKKELALTGQQLSPCATYLGPDGYRTRYFQNRRDLNKGIDFIDSLPGAPFFSQLPEDLHFNVYGDQSQNHLLSQRQNITLLPWSDPEAIPQLLKGTYGLVWASQQYPNVAGVCSEYEEYQTSVTLALHLAANEPVIVWSQSAIADFVRKNGLGLVIDSLEQLAQQVATITDSDYNDMINNVERISPLIREGFYLKRAMLNVIAMLYDRTSD
ncbi:glycosyltransferase [Lacticaseibacillus chiayiensis]|uniref:glycosyltransferase n=1 Tax=Lacticaseibacillus chiayiensis TaxID=2100821 RepID=UPI001BCB0D0D|nr:glycosyltransferase [Lacticaseibacillus chiayiensis]QVI35583.1 glycosyltransferase [Lacticaseibacillus chiayiensis]